MIGSVNFWHELRWSGEYVARNPELIVPTLPSAFLIAVANHLVWRRSLSWITAFFQWGVSVIVVILGILLGFLALGLVIALVWDGQYRERVHFQRAWRIFSLRFADILIVALMVGFLVSFFSVFFVFPGLVFGFLLMFTLPIVIIEEEDAFSAIRRSFQLSLENLGESFTFLVVVLFLGVMGYLLFWLFGFVPYAGVVINTFLGGVILTYTFTFLTRFYLALARL